MKVIAELHSHTNVSGHAFNSLSEMTRSARDAGLWALAITNHAPIRDTPTQIHFHCYRYLPRSVEGVYLISGIEVNIMDFSGNVDYSAEELAELDFRIASKHNPEDMLFPSIWGSAEENTEMYLGILRNREIDCLGHCGNAAVPFSHEEILPVAAQKGVVIEVNTSYLKRSGDNVLCYRDILKLCKKHEVRVAVTTDSHSVYTMGDFVMGIQLLEEIGYPEALVINSSIDRLRAYFREKKGRDIFEDKMCL